MPIEVLHFYLACLSATVLVTLYYIARRDTVMLKRSATILLLLHLLVLILWFGKIACLLFAVALCGVGVFEVTRHTFTRLAAYASALAITASIILLYTYDIAFWPWLWLPVVTLSFIAPNTLVAHRSWSILFAISTVGFGCLALMTLAEPVPVLWMSLILLAQCNDTLALLVGKRFGKHKLFPNLSPNKSAEGFIAGGLGVALALALIHFLYGGDFYSRLTAPSVIAFASISWIAINLGDLLFSKYKRAQGIKDFSALLPGHGGLVDRFDSLLLLAPAAYLMVNAEAFLS